MKAERHATDSRVHMRNSPSAPCSPLAASSVAAASNGSRSISRRASRRNRCRESRERSISATTATCQDDELAEGFSCSGGLGTVMVSRFPSSQLRPCWSTRWHRMTHPLIPDAYGALRVQNFARARCGAIDQNRHMRHICRSQLECDGSNLDQCLPRNAKRAVTEAYVQ